MVRTGVMRSYGTEIKRFAKNTDGKVVTPFLAGACVAIALQSSTATALLASAFSAQNFLAMSTALYIVLGADIGTAIAVLIASQKISVISPVLISLGVIGFLSSESFRSRGISRALIGLGLILLSLSLLSANAEVLADNSEFTQFLTFLSPYPLLIINLAIVITCIAHSSLAIVLLTASLVVSGTFSVEIGVYLVLGANVGSGLLPLFASWRSPKTARVPLAANLIIRTLGVGIAYVLAEQIVVLLADKMSVAIVPIALHLLLNLGVALVGLFTSSILIKFASSILTNDPKDAGKIGPKYLDNSLLNSTSQSLACAKREALGMADVVQEMLREVRDVLKSGSDEKSKAISKKDDVVDTLFNAVKLYVAKILQRPLSENETQKAMDLLSFTANLEHIGDIIDTGLLNLADKRMKQQSQFSDEGWSEIEKLLEAVSNNFELAVNTFVLEDVELAKQLVKTKPVIRDIERTSIETHFERLGTGHADTLSTSSFHLDVLRDLKRINSHLTAMAYPVLAAAGDVPHTKWKKVKVIEN